MTPSQRTRHMAAEKRTDSNKVKTKWPSTGRCDKRPTSYNSIKSKNRELHKVQYTYNIKTMEYINGVVLLYKLHGILEVLCGERFFKKFSAGGYMDDHYTVDLRLNANVYA